MLNASLIGYGIACMLMGLCAGVLILQEGHKRDVRRHRDEAWANGHEVATRTHQKAARQAYQRAYAAGYRRHQDDADTMTRIARRIRPCCGLAVINGRVVGLS